jgi:TetR/AcrR family transcriptional regulator, tetracycline repressor protein
MPSVNKTTREPLSVKLIHETTLEMIERDGLEALSMRGLAKTLGVDPMAIYHHIPNKASLLGGVYESILAELFENSEPQTTWQETLKNLARRFRSLATRYPKNFPGLIAASNTLPSMAQAVEVILELLLEAGLNPKTTVKVGDTVFAFVTGFVLLELNNLQNPAPKSRPSQGWPSQGDTEPVYAQRWFEELQTNQFPESFEFGLQLLITGIEANLPKSKRRNPKV